jgi:predicted nucleic acid-binding protein
MEIAPGIIVDEKICVGRAVLKGTRIPVDLILGKLADAIIAATAVVSELKLVTRNVDDFTDLTTYGLLL